MQFAWQCLKVGLWLLNQNDGKAAKPAASGFSSENVDEDSSQTTVGDENLNQKSMETWESNGVSNIVMARNGDGNMRIKHESQREFTTSANANGDGKESKASFGSSNPISVSVDAYEEMRRKENMAAR